jgi:hypothetical protein
MLKFSFNLEYGDVIKLYANSKFKIYEKMDSVISFDATTNNKKAIINVERPNNRHAEIRWNEDMNSWEYTIDGLQYIPLNNNTPNIINYLVEDNPTSIIDISNLVSGSRYPSYNYLCRWYSKNIK